MSDEAITMLSELMGGQSVVAVAGRLTTKADPTTAKGGLSMQQMETEKLLESAMIVAAMLGLLGKLKSGIGSPETMVTQLASEMTTLRMKAKHLAQSGDPAKLAEALKKFNQTVAMKAQATEAKLKAMAVAPGQDRRGDRDDHRGRHRQGGRPQRL